MMLKKLALMISMILLTSCATKISIVKACGLGSEYERLHLGLDENSKIPDYQVGLVIRKSEINMLNRRAKNEASCVEEIQKHIK